MKPRIPPALRQGATIAVIGPASCPADGDKLQTGLARLRALGFSVLTGRTFDQPHGYLCGDDTVRLAELNGYLRRRDVDALFCVRGGYGSLRLLAGLDYVAARAHPKLLVGYSDITALQLALFRKAGWRSLSGPMVAVEWDAPDPASDRLFWELALGGEPGVLHGPHDEPLVPLVAGEAEGVLLGGNLSMIVSMIGTPYLPSLKNVLLFVEEVGEEPYRIDRMLAQLQLSGHLDQLAGLLLGGFTNCAPRPGRPSLTLEEIFDHYLRGARYPVAKGLPYGHFPVKNTMPVGVTARLLVTERRAGLTLLEPVVQ